MKNLSKAALSFEKFCAKNEVKPTNMKAEYYLAGYYASLDENSSDVWSVLPDELEPMIEQITEVTLSEMLQNIADGYVVEENHTRGEIVNVIFVRLSNDSCSVLVHYIINGDHRLSFIRMLKLVPF